MSNAEARRHLNLNDASRILVFGTEGDTDPKLYAELIGETGDQIRAEQTA